MSPMSRCPLAARGAVTDFDDHRLVAGAPTVDTEFKSVGFLSRVGIRHDGVDAVLYRIVDVDPNGDRQLRSQIDVGDSILAGSVEIQACRALMNDIAVEASGDVGEGVSISRRIASIALKLPLRQNGRIRKSREVEAHPGRQAVFAGVSQRGSNNRGVLRRLREWRLRSQAYRLRRSIVGHDDRNILRVICLDDLERTTVHGARIERDLERNTNHDAGIDFDRAISRRDRCRVDPIAQ